MNIPGKLGKGGPGPQPVTDAPGRLGGPLKPQPWPEPAKPDQANDDQPKPDTTEEPK